MVRIVLDCMGGDNSPKAHVEGAILALKCNKYLHIILVGNSEEILQELNKYKFDKDKVDIIDARDIIYGYDDPVNSIRTKLKSSLVVALNELVDKDYDAIVSTGNSGAFLAGCLFIIGKIKGVARPALAPIISREHGRFILLDSGANVDCNVKNIIQFADFGRLYYKILFNERNPIVKLLNIGTEGNKGNSVIRKAHEELSNDPNINFKGNLEARDIFNDDANVIVCDGFVGNIALKIIEGTSKYVMSVAIKDISNFFLYKIAKRIMPSFFEKIRTKYDYRKYGGAVFLGVKKVCVKSHGDSNEIAIKNSIDTAFKLVDEKIISLLEKLCL
ncbi:fatty acid/phospholipid synthesis protein PlsX [Candidatus Arthromitus sp. SFB-mouse-Japan]|uniref:phosphate acyltransferase PlsX n=1 Tax=unclassified Candidatus Neoarthromitus TaxID=2638829 RepID=UPI00021B801E|nr:MULTISPECIES: phosphate acyltransferase PlsX [unclassified Candidatus Arthromitus]AID44577.1 Phosphate:acyl-ACP acyltransferase PlsX [Candidatus Arthromitus sp. SFB-mouse-NL]BAK56406.1 fatty acid/phospholipid synthesis protein PlsX [Candidatus Arthromitus sp. SFB-mouse-Japan]